MAHPVVTQEGRQRGREKRNCNGNGNRNPNHVNSEAVESVASFLTGTKQEWFLISLKHEACVLDKVAKWAGLGIK